MNTAAAAGYIGHCISSETLADTSSVVCDSSETKWLDICLSTGQLLADAVCSYLSDCRQSACISGGYWHCLTLVGGMTQGSLVVRLTFILLIDNQAPIVICITT